MNITRQEVDKTTLKLNVELLPAEMQPYLDKAVAKISKEVKIDGFRPGKAPYELLKKKVGEMEIYQEAAREAVNDSLPTISKREDVQFVGQPEVSIDKVVPGEPFVYSVTFALMPNVDLKGYKKINVKRPAAKMDQEKYDRTLEDLRKLHSKTQAVNRAAKEGDQVHIDFDIKLAGVSIEGGQGKNVPLVLGEKKFIPGFEDNLIGAEANDSKEFDITFPKDYGAQHLAGKECQVKATVQTVSEVILPELNDEFAKQLNFESAAQLQEQIRDNIMRELEQEVDRQFENQVIDAVIAEAEFDPIPELLIKAEQDQMYSELQSEVEYQGGKIEDYLKHVNNTEEELKKGWSEQAKKRIQAALILKTVGTQDDVKVSEDDIAAEIEQYKKTYENYPEQLAKFDSLDFQAYVRSVLRNKKVMQLLKDYAEGKGE